MLRRHPILFAMTVFAILICGVAAHRSYRHFQRQALTRPGLKNQYVETEQNLPAWIMRYGLQDWIPSSSYQDAVRISSNSDEHLATIASNFDLSRVRIIYLSGAEITDASVPLLNSCPAVSQLFLHNTGISATGYMQLNLPTDIHEIRFWGSDLPDDFFKDTNQFAKLSRVSFLYCDVTDEIIQQVSQLPQLVDFCLRDCPQVTNRGLSAFSDRSNIETFDVRSPNIDQEVLKSLPIGSEMKLLRLDTANQSSMPVETFERLSNARKLYFLDLSGVAVDGNNPARILDQSSRSTLVLNDIHPGKEFCKAWINSEVGYLGLSADHLMPESIVHLNQLDLKSRKSLALHIRGTQSDTPNYEHLTELTALNWLVFENVELQDAHVELIHNSGVRRIRMGNVALNDARLSWLKDFDQLDQLHLIDISLSPSDFKAFQHCRIDGLLLINCDVSDESLEVIKNMPYPPKYIRIRGNPHSSVALRNLIDAFPDTRIDF